jgi:DnaK suppressor protein
MKNTQRNRLRLHLEQELVSLNNAARICRFPLVCPDENELASLVAEQNLNNALYSRLLRRMEELREAVCRLDDNAYGVCAICGDGIDLLRLLAAPAATLCIQCQEELEDGALRQEVPAAGSGGFACIGRRL